MKKKNVKTNQNNQRLTAEQVKTKQRYTLLMSVVIALFVIIAGLAFVIIGLAVQNKETKGMLENTYQKSLYDMTDNLNDIEMKLSKLMVSNSRTKRTELASDIWMQSSTAESNLGQLPLEHGSINKTSKFVNQLGDYVYSLNRKLADGGKYSEEDESRISDLYEMCKSINEDLRGLTDKVGADYRITDHINRGKLKRNGNKEDALGKGFGDMQSNRVDYPEMIYDGPFSDALDKREYAGIKDKEDISPEQGAAWLKEKFEKDGNAEYTGQSENRLRTYQYNMKTGGGEERYVQLSVKGGLPVLINGTRGVAEVKLDEEAAIKKAEEWGAKLLDDTLRSVWISVTTENIAYINLAPEVNDIIYYPDLVKVKIALDDGELLGWEAKAYLQNHTEREISAAKITQEEAVSKAGGLLTVTGVRQALIPKDWGTEVLAWELNCERNEDNYIIYINGESGEEENILKVIDTGDQGYMLI